jgi:hypothetical protein
LELGSADVERQIEHRQLAGEVRRELRRRVVKNGAARVRETLRRPANSAEPHVGGDETKCSDGCFDDAGRHGSTIETRNSSGM